MAESTYTDFSEGWTQIQHEGIDRLLAFFSTGEVSFSRADYSRLYTIVYNMCIQRNPHNYSQQLYEAYRATFRDYLRMQVLPDLQSKHDSRLLLTLTRVWQNHQIMVKWMRAFFQYLDRHFVSQNKLPRLDIQAMRIFIAEVYTPLRIAIVQAISSQVRAERDRETIDQSCVRETVIMLNRLGTASEDPVKPMKALCDEMEKATEDYYEAKAKTWITENSCPEYLLKAETALMEERRMIEGYLDSSLETPILSKFYHAVIEVQETDLLEKETGLLYLLQQNKRADLGRLYRLCSKVNNALVPIADTLSTYIASLGNTIVNERDTQGKVDKKEDSAFIKRLIDLHDSFKSLVAECLSDHSIFQRCLKSAFEKFMNRQVGKNLIAGLIASFCDRALKRTAERLSEEQLEELLTKCVHLFEHITDKDYFSNIYRSKLAKRLLNDDTASDDAERSMIAKLKMLCGAQFTSKMEGMINDLRTAAEVQRKFEQTAPSLPVEFSVQVLAISYWPTYPSHNVPLPTSLAGCISTFNRFYEIETKHRNLKWMNSLGAMTITARLPTGRSYDFICSTYQGCALMLFNERQSLNFGELRGMLQMDDETCKRLLASLSCSKIRVLEKTGNPKAVEAEDSFTVKDNFESKMRKIRLPQPASEETAVEKRVEEDRSIAIEAAIVRVMKSRKTLSHNELLQEVLGMLSLFKPKVKDIKQRVEMLIEREYLERDKKCSTVYHYLA